MYWMAVLFFNLLKKRADFKPHPLFNKHKINKVILPKTMKGLC